MEIACQPAEKRQPPHEIALPDLPTGGHLPFVSVVVPTYRRERLLCQTLQSLFNQSYPRMEIVVIDQTERHEDDTAGFLEEHAGRLRIIASAPPGVARARSIGALAAKGEIVLYVDDDVLCCRDLVVHHVRAHQVSRVGAVAGRITDDSEPDPPAGPVGRLFSNGTVTRHFASQVRQFVDHAPGANMSFKRDLLVQAGLFEPTMGGTARFEETDACIRVARLGHGVLFEPAAHVHHLGGPGGQSFGAGFELWYRTVVHNGLLMVWRNFSLRYWPLAFLYRFRNAFYLGRRDRSALPLRIFFEEAFRSFCSYPKSAGSLPRGVPRWRAEGPRAPRQ